MARLLPDSYTLEAKKLYNEYTQRLNTITKAMNTPFQLALQDIANRDVSTLLIKDAEYGSSWKKRGGIGAFMMLARKWDRLEQQVQSSNLDQKFDIFDAIEHNTPADGESVLETIRDLRRYLLLVESEIVLRKQVDRGGTVVHTGDGRSGVAPIVDTEDR